jgi:hypothetical protein
MEPINQTKQGIKINKQKKAIKLRNKKIDRMGSLNGCYSSLHRGNTGKAAQIICHNKPSQGIHYSNEQ